MTLQQVLLPVFVQVALTFGLLVWLGRARIAALRLGMTRMEAIRLGEPVWPPRVMQVDRAFHNQFEIPTLFYVLVVVAILTRKDDLLFVIMSWLFVASRLAHAFVHVTTNHLPHRFGAFLVGVAILVVMWIVLAIRVLAS